jgi:hypothetical protein
MLRALLRSTALAVHDCTLHIAHSQAIGAKIIIAINARGNDAWH